MTTKSVLTLLILLLIGCSSSNTDDLQQWMQINSQGLRGQTEPLPPARSYVPFAYQAYDLLDPFNPQKLIVAKTQTLANAPDFKRPREALENYDLDKLKMVGTMHRNNVTYALVRTPDGAIYRVQDGHFIGPSFGLIKKISEKEITLSETVEDLNGEWVQRVTSLYLDEQGQNK